MLFCPSALTVAKGGALQMSDELTKRPFLPPSSTIVKRSMGASGRSLKSVRIPCFAGPIFPSKTIRIAPDLKEATRSGSLCSEERK